MTTCIPVGTLRRDDTDEIADVIASAFTHLAISRWLVPDNQVTRRWCLRDQFILQVEYAFDLGARVEGIRDPSGRLLAAAVWVPPSLPDAPPAPAGYDQRLQDITGRYYSRFRTLDDTFAAHTPFYPHTHLSAIASTDRGRGLGSQLLTSYLAWHDSQRDPPPICLDASGPAAARLYRRHGFTDGDPVEIPGSNGLHIYPMRRDPAASAPPRPGTGALPRNPGAENA